MLKKILGVVLFLFGIILLLSILSTVLKTILIEDDDLVGKDESYVTAYYIGIIVVVLIFCFLNFLCFKYGYRLIKGNKKAINKKAEIDSIGKIEDL